MNPTINDAIPTGAWQRAGIHNRWYFLVSISEANLLAMPMLCLFDSRNCGFK